ncbi:MAG TPA: ABC transporter substrate-binding protein, partial [Polyangiaceae bacterium]|nr:ABC transporter substrate-binding protein [Polyangiaceae bacterium]
LARALPDATAQGSRIALRPGLVTARGRALDAADVVASIERSRKLAARPLLSGFGAVRRVRDDPLAVDCTGVSPAAAADALSSPLTALVPRTFSASKPDGTGAFRADPTARGVTLVRNERAARGPSFLDRVEVRKAADLAAGLRAFESGEADVGFLGAGLHRRRAGALDFRTESVGWIVLRTGPEAGEWGAPGVAARLVEALDPARLSHLGLAPPGARATGRGWGGAAANLYVDEGSSYLVEVARAVATAISQPGREIRPAPLPHAEVARLRDGGHFATMIDFVRRLGPSPRHAALSLLGAANPRLADKPPRTIAEDIAVLTRTLPLAVLGELRLAGARAPDVHGLEQWDLGSMWRGV